MLAQGFLEFLQRRHRRHPPPGSRAGTVRENVPGTRQLRKRRAAGPRPGVGGRARVIHRKSAGHRPGLPAAARLQGATRSGRPSPRPMISPIRTIAPGETPGSLARELEAGAVLLFPDLPFPFSAFERRFTERPFADGKAKNVNIRGEAASCAARPAPPEEQEALRQLLIRYRAFARDLIGTYLPGLCRPGDARRHLLPPLRRGPAQAQLAARRHAAARRRLPVEPDRREADPAGVPQHQPRGRAAPLARRRGFRLDGADNSCRGCRAIRRSRRACSRRSASPRPSARNTTT